jgi:hypothetical protein
MDYAGENPQTISPLKTTGKWAFTYMINFTKTYILVNEMSHVHSDNQKLNLSVLEDMSVLKWSKS